MATPLSNPSYLLPPVFAFAACLALFALILFKSRSSPNRQVFLCLLGSMALWNLATFGMRASPDVYRAVVWERAIPVAHLAVFVFYYHFAIVYRGVRMGRVETRTVLAAYLFLVVLASLAPTDLIIREMYLADYGYAPVLGPAGYLLAVPGLLLMGGATVNLVRGYRLSRSYEQRNRILYIMAAILFPLVGGLLDAFSDLPPAAIWGNLMFCVVCSIAILKYHLLDIRIVVRKGLAYLLISAMIGLPYAGVILLLPQILRPRLEPWWIHAAMILLLALALQPLYGWARRLVDRLFYRERYDYLRALEQFGRESQSIVNLEPLTSTMTRLVSGALRASCACLLLASETSDGFRVASCTGLDSTPSGIVLRANSPLVRWLERHQGTLSSTELGVVPQLQNLSLREKKNLERMGTSLCVPVKSRHGQLSGILVLGEKLSQQPYSNEDKQMLTALNSQMAVALENARLYRDALRTRENLETWLNSMTDYVMIVNTDYATQFLNKAARDEFGGEAGDKCWHVLGRDAVCPGCPVQHYLRGNRDGLRYVEHIGGRQYEVAAAPLLEPAGNISVLHVLRDITESKRIEEELLSSRQQLRDLAAHLQSVREDERTGIARELHDEMGQTLTALKMDLSWLKKQLPGDQKSLLEKVKLMLRLTDTTIQSVKRISMELRPGLLDDLGLAAAIEWQAEEFQRRSGISCEVAIASEDFGLEQALSTAVFRIFQETLTNVARHARAARVKGSLKEEAGNLVLRVIDDGKGITEKQVSDPKSLGLIGMRERVRPWGGEVRISGIRGRGTTVMVSIPLGESQPVPDRPHEEV